MPELPEVETTRRGIAPALVGQKIARVIVREEWPTGWVENSPTIAWLNDGKRFIWESERNGWNNLLLYDISGKLLTPLTAFANGSCHSRPSVAWSFSRKHL